jgi:hypothetical protein
VLLNKANFHSNYYHYYSSYYSTEAFPEDKNGDGAGS